jgi:uncharacterized protein YxjI
MAIEPVILTPTSPLASTLTEVYAVPANGKVVVKRAAFVNVSNAPQTFTVYRVPSSGSAVDGNIMIKEFRLSAGESYVTPELTNLVLTAGDSLQMLASDDDVVNVTISGLSV